MLPSNFRYERRLLSSVNERKLQNNRFKYNSKIFEFQRLPFGLNIAPYIFTKLVKPVIQHIREKLNVLCVIYLDDILMIEETEKECAKSITITINLVTELGLLINKNKSQLTPTRELQFLVYIYDTTDLTIKLSNDKKLTIIKTLKKFVIFTKKRTFLPMCLNKQRAISL